MPINFAKKKEKLNKFMKLNDREVYYRMFHSRALMAPYNYMEIEEDIKKLVKSNFDGADCEIFYLGSRVIGLGYQDESDLDLFIDIGNCYFTERDYDYDVEQIEYIKNILNEMPSKWRYKKINYTVPSLKAVHLNSGILCDISITNGLAVHNSRLLSHLFNIQSEAVAMFHYIKKWLQIFDVRFKGFSLTLMVIFYLQQRSLLPKIRDVQRGVYPEIIIDNYAVQFDESRDRSYYGVDEMTYYKDHLKDFFRFYGNYDFTNKIICTYSGKSFKKECYPEKIESQTPVTIAAPLLRRTNCAKYITNLQLAEFIETCWFSFDYLEEYKPPKCSNDFEFYSENQYYGKFNNYEF